MLLPRSKQLVQCRQMRFVRRFQEQRFNAALILLGNLREATNAAYMAFREVVTVGAAGAKKHFG